MLIDLHAKSSHSDDVTLSVDEVLTRAKEAGIQGVAFTERLSSARCEEAIAAGQRHDMRVFIGVEIPTDYGIVLGFLPEIDAYYIEEQWRELTDYITPPIQDVVDAFTSRGGAVIAARPYDLEIPYNMGDTLFRVQDLSGVEVFNPNVGELQNDLALEAARARGLSTVGGSDPRGAAKGIGTFATLFLEEIRSQGELIEALKSHAFWAVQLDAYDFVLTSLANDVFAQKRGREERGGGGRGGRRDEGGSRERRGSNKNGGDNRSGGGRRRGNDRNSGARSSSNGDSRRRGRGNSRRRSD